MLETSTLRETLNIATKYGTPKHSGTNANSGKKNKCRDYEETYIYEENRIAFSQEARLENSRN